MDITELIKNNRSYRRFDEDVHIPYNKLESYVDLARHSASGTNRQPLKFLIYSRKEECRQVFPYTRWAGYLKDWAGPVEGERPSSYIIILGDQKIATNYFVDHGIAAQSILLGAVADGFGGCMIGSIDRKGLIKELKMPDQYEVLLIIALGVPAEKVVIDNIENGKIEYWRDDQDVHHVPKRELKELIINGKWK